MKLLHLVSSSGYYGVEAVVVNLCMGLTALGTFSTVGVFDNSRCSNLEVAKVARQKGLSVAILSCRGRADWTTVRRIADLARLAEADFIHAHGYKAQVYGYLASKLHPIRLVATYHGYSSRFSGEGRATLADLRHQLYDAMDLALLRRFDRIVAPSRMLERSLLSAGIAREKLTVIGNGIELEGFSRAAPSADLSRLKSGGLAIGVVARLTEGKGHGDLFLAVKGILAEYPLTQVFVIGDGPLRLPLEALARELGIERSVIFTGKRSDMASVYAALDVVVLPSLFEGMPMVILEALAARKPVIATRVGAVPGVIRELSTGLLIEPGDSRELQRAIKRLIVDDGLRSTLAENGYEQMRAQYSAAGMAGNYQRVYESALRR
jgi:glycosyltransferase involved in cell wall biosynthesis